MNSTQLTGFMAFGMAAAVSAMAASRSRHAVRNGWAGIALVQVVLCLDIAFDWRYHLHGVLLAWFKQQGRYETREGVQIAAMGLLALLFAGFVVAACRASRKVSGSVQAAAIATVFGVGLAITEVISLHAIDRWLYRPLGPMPTIGWLWLAGTAAVAVSGIRALKNSQRP